MSDILIVGTIALDTIETPFGKVGRSLGGSATYASFAASFFSKPAVISVIGKDFPKEHKYYFFDPGLRAVDKVRHEPVDDEADGKPLALPGPKAGIFFADITGGVLPEGKAFDLVLLEEFRTEAVVEVVGVVSNLIRDIDQIGLEGPEPLAPVLVKIFRMFL